MTTLLVEKCNDNKPSFIDYICAVKKESISLSDEEIWEIRKKLCVHSMEELVELFQPEIVITIGQEQITIPICHKDGFFYQLMQLWETIRQGRYTVITKKELEERLLVHDGVSEEAFLEAQKQIFSYLQQGKVKAAEQQIKSCKSNFQDTLFLTKRFIKQAEFYVKKSKEEHKRFVVETGKNMSLQCIVISEAFQSSLYHTKYIEEQYQQLLEQWLEPKDKLLYWNLLLSCNTLPEEKMEQLKVCLEEQKQVYKKAKKVFWYQAKPVIQTLFQCYCYFQNPKAEEVLLTNCTVEELAATRNQKALQRYLETTNHKLYPKDRIQKAILPNIEEKKGIQNPVRKRFHTGEKEKRTYSTNTLEAAQGLQSTLQQYKIETNMVMCDVGEPLGYVLTGIDVLKMPDSENVMENKLRDLTIWLNELKFQGEW